MGVEGIAPKTAWDMACDVMRFEQWAGDRLQGPQDITRRLLVDWLVHNKATLPSRAVSQRLSRLRLFLDHARVGGLAIGADATYLPGELAIRGELDRPPKYFDDSELAQLDAPDNLARLNDYNRRAYLVLRHTGMRTRSLVHIPFDCLRVVDGAAYLTFFNTKRRGGTQEHTIPISPELGDVVREQQHWVRSFWPDEQPTWLFPARTANPTGSRPAHRNSIGNTLVKWVRVRGIEAGDGQDLHFWPHRLRHTLGTQMINDGVPQRAVQDYYGHASPEMTAHYAKLLVPDAASRDRRVSRPRQPPRRTHRCHAAGNRGERRSAQGAHARAKQTLPNGYCGIPIQSKCPHPNACLSCDAFLTDESFRPVLAEQRTRARQHADSAAAAGLDRVVEINFADVAALDAVLTGLDELAAQPQADDAFDVRELGAA